MPEYVFTSPEGAKFYASGDSPDAAFASARPITDEEMAKAFGAQKGMKFEPFTKTRGEYLSEIPGKVAESLLPLSATGPSDKAKQEFHHWQEDQLKKTGYAPFAPWEHGGNPVLGAVELGASLPLGAGAKAAAAGASKVLPAMAGTFFKGKPVPYGFWSDAEAVNLIRKRISEGATRKQIHEEFGQGALDIMKRLKIGTENRRGRPNPPDELLDEIDRLAAEGKMTWRQIGEAVGLSTPEQAFHLSRRRALRLGNEVGSSGEAPQVSKWVTDPAAGVKSRVSSSDPLALMRALQASQRPKTDPLKAGGPLASPDDVLEKRAIGAGSKKTMPEPLERDVLERGRSGRPVATSPLATGTEDAILQKGFGRNAVFAYHASPHDFDKFDLSKMGTGQGAQSYGAGHYLAESPEVSGRGGAYDEEFSSKLQRDLNPQHRIAAAIIGQFKGDREAAYKDAIDAARTYSGTASNNYYEAARLIKSGWEPPKAKIYETVIKAPQEHFLDWDRPFLEQTPHVQAAIEKVLPGTREAAETSGKNYDAERIRDTLLGNDPGSTPASVSEKLRQAGIPGIKYLDEKSRHAGQVSVQTQYRDSRIDNSNQTYERFFSVRFKQNGGNLERTISALRQDLERHPEDATVKKTLEFAQDPGNKFTLDQSSQTRNFVVFDDKTIDVLKKYAPPAVATGGGAAAAMEAGGDDPLAK